MYLHRHCNFSWVSMSRLLVHRICKSFTLYNISRGWPGGSVGKGRNCSSKGLRFGSKDSQLGLGQKTARGLKPGLDWGGFYYSEEVCDGEMGEREKRSGVCAVRRSKTVRSNLT